MTDSQLSCAEIESEIKEATEFEEKAREEKGVTGTNTVAAIFFWPALFLTYANVDAQLTPLKIAKITFIAFMKRRVADYKKSSWAETAVEF